MTALSSNDPVRELILDVLAPKLSQIGSPTINDDTNLVVLGLIDSADLVDVIISVEERAGMVFNPEGLDLETGLTLRQLMRAFAPASEPGQPRTASIRR